MFSSAFKTAGCLLFVFCISVYAQNPAKKPATSTIGGKVTLKGTGVAGISVGAREKESNRQRRTSLGTTTDSQGNYRIANVPPGTYEIVLGSPQFVLTGYEAIKTLMVSEGETYEGIDFTLVRGGVITGRVMDSEGRPIIEENVEIYGSEGTPSRQPYARLSTFFTRTDDRGVYRVYGLPPGKYQISAGMREEEMYYGRIGRTNYKQTFHPSTTDQAKATLVEVTEGGEATNVDITLRRPQATFVVSGKVVDADTGRPISDVTYGLQKYRKDGSSSSSGMVTNKQGEFRFDNVTPGKYAVYIESSRTVDVNADPVRFEVTDQDISGLVLKASAGNTISGIVIVDGVDEKTGRSLLNGMTILTQNENEPEQFRVFRPAHGMVNPDGSFRLSGVRPGVVEFIVFSALGSGSRECEVIRIERNGVAGTRSLEIKDREHISGLRLFVKYHKGSVRGIVKIENGELPTTSRVLIFVERVGDQKFQTSVELDARGRFSLDGLKPGVYEILAAAYVQGFSKAPQSEKQQVVVADNEMSEVTLTLNLKP